MPPSSHTGGLLRARKSPFTGLCGDMIGANSAANTSMASIADGSTGHRLKFAYALAASEGLAGCRNVSCRSECIIGCPCGS